MKVYLVKLEDLKPSEYNPRAMSEKEANELEESLKRFGFVEPIVVNGADGRKNIVIGGHQRYFLAKKMGMKEIPVVYVDIPDVKKERELNLRLNKNVGHWDFDLLAKFDGKELEIVGFDMGEIGLIAGEFSRGEDFEEIVDKFEETKTSEKNANWFYIEFYKDDAKYEELKKLFGDKVSSTGHEIESDFFYDLIKRALKK